MTDLSQPPEHARRVHRHAWWTLIFVPLALVTGIAWVLLKAFVCWSSRGGAAAQQLCEWAFVIPDGLLVLAGLCFAAMLLGLGDLGARLLKDTHRFSLHAVRHGYGALEHAHRQHVSRASRLIGWGFAAFVGTLSWYVFKAPEWAALLITLGLGTASMFATKPISTT